MSKIDIQHAPINPTFCDHGDPIPDGVVGSTITAFGSIDGAGTEDAGLVIELKSPNGASRRLVLGFTELGMWVAGDYEQS